ncbi:hypothetical protein [Prosthecobacter sp.]|nr:hypothetical protein [Prosthecobacter sp.]MDZ4402052.1 hypothetical protein [Prosthecobacter sp.]
MKPNLFFLAAALVMLSGCDGFKPVDLEPDEKEPTYDTKQDNWMPKNS